LLDEGHGAYRLVQELAVEQWGSSKPGAGSTADHEEAKIMTYVMILLLAVVIGGCSKPSAMSVCKQLEAAKIGANCHEEKAAGLGAAAIERAEFTLPSVPGKGGMVLLFEKKEYYQQTVDAFAKAAILAGPHRYGSESKLIFVQMNEGASLETGKATKALVDAL
jgi:hypothetical protein